MAVYLFRNFRDARTPIFGAAAVPTELFACVIPFGQAYVLYISRREMETAHAAVVVPLLLVVMAVAALELVRHSSSL